jgi:hypothetical protein
MFEEREENAAAIEATTGRDEDSAQHAAHRHADPNEGEADPEHGEREHAGTYARARLA